MESTVRYVVLGPASPRSVGYNTNEFFLVFIDFFTLLSSIEGFPDE